MTSEQTDADRHAWERPGAFTVAPGVHRIPLPLPGDVLKAVNVYVVEDGDQAVCIDGGWAMAESADLLAAGLREIGYEPGQVREYLVTHHHRDHYTNAVAMRRLHGSTVSLGEGERACIALLQADDGSRDVPRLVAAGAQELATTLLDSWPERTPIQYWEDPDRWLPNGVDLPLSTRTLRVIATPGHTRGHVVFHDPANQALFAGDHVLPHITPSIGVEINRPPSPLRDYLSSLELVRALPDARLLPAHGPVAVSVHDRIDELLHHHDERLDATERAVSRGHHTGFEVAQVLGWTRRNRSFTDLDLTNKILAVQETVAHLVVLAERGRLRETTVEGVVHFSPA